MRPDEHRRAVPRCELLPLRGQRSGESRKRGGPMNVMRRDPLALLVSVIALALATGCASNKTDNTPPAQPRVESVKAQEATPLQRAQIKTDLAAGYYERAQFEVALEVLDEAQKIDANYPKIYNVYGLVYTML